jgi:endonuclease YncB( thermonuclease family)
MDGNIARVRRVPAAQYCRKSCDSRVDLHHGRMPSRLAALCACLIAALFATGVTRGEVARLAGTVVGVVDGDTVDVRLASGMIRIRLHAIDAPEMGQSGGQASKQALAALVFGQSVLVEPYEQDRYDRLVARLWLDGLDVNAAMVKQGRAWAYRRYADDQAYCGYEKAARDLRRGLWALPAAQRPAPWEWRQRKTLEGHFTDYSNETVAACIAALGKTARQ